MRAITHIGGSIRMICMGSTSWELSREWISKLQKKRFKRRLDRKKCHHDKCMFGKQLQTRYSGGIFKSWGTHLQRLRRICTSPLHIVRWNDMPHYVMPTFNWISNLEERNINSMHGIEAWLYSKTTIFNLSISNDIYLRRHGIL